MVDSTNFYSIWDLKLSRRGRGVSVELFRGWSGGPKQGYRRGNDRSQPLLHDESEVGIPVTGEMNLIPE